MSTHLSITKTLDFKEFPDRNKVFACPNYLDDLFTNEYSPIKTLLQTIAPPVKIILNIEVEIIKE